MYSNKRIYMASAISALGLAAVSPGVNVYFGQVGADTLASYCESGSFDSVTLAYLSASPETDPATNYPATNFGTHCSASVYVANNSASRLLSDCTTLSRDIQFCQQKGIKVLLSTGGVWGPDSEHNYDVTTEANGQYFAEFLWKAFGPFDPTWTGPRPFDIALGRHTVLDGFDFDIKVQFGGQSGYIALLTRFRTYVDAYNGASDENSIIITGAPMCPLADSWSEMKDLIVMTAFDKLWIQFYGNDLCQAGSSGFNYDDWETFIANTTSKNALLYVGLPASLDVPGYITAAQANTLVDGLKDRPSFGGVMVWDAAIAKGNVVGGVPIYQAIYDHLVQEGPSSSLTTAASGTSSTVAATTASSEDKAGSITKVVTKTESPAASVTKTVFPTASSSVPQTRTNSTIVGTRSSGHIKSCVAGLTTETVIASATCGPASHMVSTSSGVSVSLISDGLPSFEGQRTKFLFLGFDELFRLLPHLRCKISRS